MYVKLNKDMLKFFSLVFLSCFLLLFLGLGYKDANLLWLGLLFLYLCTLYSLLLPLKFSHKSLILVAFLETILLSSSGLEWGHYVPSGDTSFWIQVTEIIKEEGRWRIGIGTFRGVSYSQYPVLGILGAIVSTILPLDLITYSRFISTIIPLITLLFYLLFVREITGSEKVAVLSGLVFASNPHTTVFNILEPYHYEQLSIAYVLMTLYLIQAKFSYRQRATSILLAVLIPLVAMTHHWGSYNLLLLISAFFLLPLLYSYFKGYASPGKTQFKGILYIFTYAVAVILAYGIYVSYAMFSLYIKLIAETSPEIASPIIRYNPWDYSILELLIIIAGHLVLIAYGLLGLLKSFKSTKFMNRIVECSFLMGGIYFPTLFLLYSGLTFTYTLRLYPYFFIMISPMVALGMLSTNKKVRVTTALTVLILLSSFSITGIFHKLNNPVYSQTSIVYLATNAIKLEKNTYVIYPPPPFFQIIVAYEELEIPAPSVVTPTIIYKCIDSYNITTLMKTSGSKYLFFYKGWVSSEIDKFFIKPYYNSTFMEIFYKISSNPSLNVVYDNGIFIMLSTSSRD